MPRQHVIARWHRRLAAVAWAWLALLLLTGVVVNHAHGWGLDRKPLPATLARWVYGVEAPAGVDCGHVDVEKETCDGVFAVFVLEGASLLVTDTGVFLAAADGHLIEAVPSGVLGVASIEAAAFDGGTVYLEGPEGVVRADAELLEYRLLAPDAPGLPGADAWRVRGPGVDTITWERALLDAHAGRFLGPFAQAFTDLMAALIAALALSGGWLWWKRRRRA